MHNTMGHIRGISKRAVGTCLVWSGNTTITISTTWGSHGGTDDDTSSKNVPK